MSGLLEALSLCPDFVLIKILGGVTMGLAFFIQAEKSRKEKEKKAQKATEVKETQDEPKKKRSRKKETDNENHTQKE